MDMVADTMILDTVITKVALAQDLTKARLAKRGLLVTCKLFKPTKMETLMLKRLTLSSNYPAKIRSLAEG